MKNRNGFVSNSSASSFIVALSPGCDHGEFLGLFKPTHCDYEATEIFSKDFCEIIGQLGDEGRGWRANLHDATVCMGELRDLGWDILHLRISYHDHKALDALDAKIGHYEAEILFTGE